MADAAEEKNVINGRVFPMENYGTLRDAEEDRVHILEEDELVCVAFNLGKVVLWLAAPGMNLKRQTRSTTDTVVRLRPRAPLVYLE